MLRRTTLTAALLALFFADSTSAADIDYSKQIQPIFMEHCAGCHGEKKGLGKLRLHTPAALQEKWDKDEHLVVKGKPDESELYERLVLPAGHKKLMPKKADPLPKEKIALIRQWIEQGAIYTVVTAAKPPAVTSSDATEKHSGGHAEKPAAAPKELPLPEVDVADPAAIDKITAAGGQVTSLYAGSSLLQISFALRGEPATDADVALLEGVAEQVYSLNLAKAQVSDQGLAVLSKLKNLSSLHLENSSVEDSGMSHLSSLASLQYLNLYGTGITDAGLKPLEGLKHLRKLYLWQTKVFYDKAKAMEKQLAGLTIDLGFDHPVVMRKRLQKQLKQAQEILKKSEADFRSAKAALDRVKGAQESSKKQLSEIQKKLNSLDSKAQPESQEEKPKEDAKAENKA